ncbi:MAG: tRNA (guanosine(46)-N7)-methyltransferase TrmB [Pseudomonadota bacterium]
MSDIPKRSDGAPWRNFYGRRHGKTMRPRQKDLIANYLPGLTPAGIAWHENPDRNPVDFGALVSGTRETWLEIGFGGGEHLLAMAERYPGIAILGCEPFMNGVAMCLSAHERKGLSNVRIHAGDAREVFDVATGADFTRVFVNYPDPWPKTRHHERRFIGRENLPHLARIIAPGGLLHVASDIPDYIRHTLKAMRPLPEFRWTAERPADWREPWSDWPSTRYEAKAMREGRTPCYLTFERV